MVSRQRRLQMLLFTAQSDKDFKDMFRNACVLLWLDADIAKPPTGIDCASSAGPPWVSLLRTTASHFNFERLVSHECC